ncbi:hypothetical protein D3C80_1569950 [compost metagenome]
MHFIPRIDVVFEQDRNPVHRAPRSLQCTFPIQSFGDEQRIRIDLQHRVDRQAVFVMLGNALVIHENQLP